MLVLIAPFSFCTEDSKLCLASFNISSASNLHRLASRTGHNIKGFFLLFLSHSLSNSKSSVTISAYINVRQSNFMAFRQVGMFSIIEFISSGEKKGLISYQSMGFNSNCTITPIHVKTLISVQPTHSSLAGKKLGSCPEEPLLTTSVNGFGTVKIEAVSLGTTWVTQSDNCP